MVAHSAWLRRFTTEATLPPLQRPADRVHGVATEQRRNRQWKKRNIGCARGTHIPLCLRTMRYLPGDGRNLAKIHDGKSRTCVGPRASGRRCWRGSYIRGPLPTMRAMRRLPDASGGAVAAKDSLTGQPVHGGRQPSGCKTACKTFQIPGVNSVQKFPPWSVR